MADPASGTLRPDVLGERVMHAMIHYTCSNDCLPASLEALKEVSSMVNTVFSVGFSNLLADGVAPAISIAEGAGLTTRPHAKTNVGLGSAHQKEVRS